MTTASSSKAMLTVTAILAISSFILIPGHAIVAAESDQVQIKALGPDYEPSEVTVQAGSILIVLTNAGTQYHNLVLQSPDGKIIGGIPSSTEWLPPKRSAQRVFDLSPGTYVFYCSYPEHRAAGMEGRIIVR